MAARYPALILLALAPTAGAVPMQLVHQGRLMDDLGAPLSGAHDLELTVFDAPVLGNALWTDIVLVTMDDGYYSATLGASPAAPLDDALFATSDLYLEIAVDGAAPLPVRQRIVSAPYAVRAGTASSVDGGVVDASEVQIAGVTVIDGSGTFLGPADGDTLAELPCAASEVALYDGASWTCADPLVDLEVGWLDVDDIPADIADGDDDVLGALVCSDDQIARWNGARWECDFDAVLSEIQVESFVTNGPLDLNVFTTLNGAPISTGDHTVDTVLLEQDVEDYITNDPIDLNPGTTLGGEELSTGPHATDTFLSEEDVENYIVNGPIDLHASTTIDGQSIATGPHAVDTTLTAEEVDAFVLDGPLPGDLVVAGSVQVGDNPADCIPALEGTLRWTATQAMELCTEAGWILVAGVLDGSAPTQAPRSCDELAESFPELGDGGYWIDPNGPPGTDSVFLWCDLTGLTVRTRIDPTFKSYSWQCINCGGIGDSDCVPDTVTGHEPHRRFGDCEVGVIQYMDEAGVTIPDEQLAALAFAANGADIEIEMWTFDTETCSYAGTFNYYDGTTLTTNDDVMCNDGDNDSWGSPVTDNVKVPYIENGGAILKSFDPTDRENWGVFLHFVDGEAWLE